MTDHVLSPDTARALVAAGFDMVTTLVWYRARHTPHWTLAVDREYARDSKHYEVIPAPMATEIMEWHKGMSIYCNSDGFHSTMIRRWSHPNPAEAVAALVLEGLDD